MLQGVARTLRSYVNATQHAYYGAKGDERKARSFAEHFPAVTRLVSEWNKQIVALEAERRELREWVEERLRALAYDQPPFAWGWAGVISGSAEADDAELPFHVTPLQPLWLELGPWPVIPDPPPNGRTRRDIEDEFRTVLSEAVEQPQREQIRQIHSSLSEASETLIEGLDLIAEKDVINGLGDCCYAGKRHAPSLRRGARSGYSDIASAASAAPWPHTNSPMRWIGRTRRAVRGRPRCSHGPFERAWRCDHLLGVPLRFGLKIRPELHRLHSDGFRQKVHDAPTLTGFGEERVFTESKFPTLRRG